jgi:hypothetical protein
MAADEASGGVPRGIEVLVKKAAVDPEFHRLLLDRRSKAADAIGLVLQSAEAAMLDVVPRAQLEAIIARTTVHPSQLPAFLGYAAGVMLVALGATGCDKLFYTLGISPDRAGAIKEEQNPDNATKPAVTRGIRPDRPQPKLAPDNQTVPPVTKGIRPDLPPAKGAPGAQRDAGK